MSTNRDNLPGTEIIFDFSSGRMMPLPRPIELAWEVQAYQPFPYAEGELCETCWLYGPILFGDSWMALNKLIVSHRDHACPIDRKAELMLRLQPSGYTDKEWNTRCPFCSAQSGRRCQPAARMLSRRSTYVGLTRPHKARSKAATNGN